MEFCRKKKTKEMAVDSDVPQNAPNRGIRDW
jgi:hypothetical protein